jgi:hypothetical protein
MGGFQPDCVADPPVIAGPLLVNNKSIMVTMLTMGGDLQPGCLADRLQ